MEIVDIMRVLTRGEDSENQFKKNINNGDSLAGELIAFSNTLGGKIFVGVDDDGNVIGLSKDDIKRINKLLSNVASENVRPAINPKSKIVELDQKNIMVIDVDKEINKPYMDKNGAIWVKNGADKRKATAREELQRLFQESGMVHADIGPVGDMTIADLDMPYFRTFFQKLYSESLEDNGYSLEKTIENLKLGKEGKLNLTGALLFSQSPSTHLPSCIVKAVAFPGESIAAENYLDSRNISGKMSDIFQQAVSFILINTRQVQGEQDVNSIGQHEIPKIVLQELVANALVHRDYFISASIRIFVLSNRVEIISPGCLPNTLTVSNIKSGVSISRNPVLASYATSVLPYRGIGSGILRSLEKYQDIEFINDRDSNLFKCIIKRA